MPFPTKFKLIHYQKCEQLGFFVRTSVLRKLHGRMLMIRAAFTTCMALMVIGCGPTLKQSSSAGGMLKLGGLIPGESEAIMIAEAECAKHGKVARIANKDFLSETLTYECANP